MSNGKKHKTSANHNAASMSIDGQAALGGGAMVSDDSQPAAPERPPRIRLHSGQNLHVPESILDRENYAYRWFAENSIKGGRVESAKGAYWELFSDDSGNTFRRNSGQDQMFFMKLEIQFWHEDQKLKEARSRATLSQETAIGAGEYAPTVDGQREGGTSAITRSAS